MAEQVSTAVKFVHVVGRHSVRNLKNRNFRDIPRFFKENSGEFTRNRELQRSFLSLQSYFHFNHRQINPEVGTTSKNNLRNVRPALLDLGLRCEPDCRTNPTKVRFRCRSITELTHDWLNCTACKHTVFHSLVHLASAELTKHCLFSNFGIRNAFSDMA
jgi:hypothetical protein